MSSRSSRRSSTRTLAMVCALVLLGACGSDAPEDKLARAADEFDEARENVLESHQEITALEQTVTNREQELERARRELRQAQGRLLSATERLERRATDVAIFRELQGRLLSDDDLETVGVWVEVEDGRATVYGEVEEDPMRVRALELARSTPGVVSVIDRIEVDG